MLAVALAAAENSEPQVDPATRQKSASGERPLGSESRAARDVHFLFEVKCQPCHGQRRQEAQLDLRTVTSMLKGGKSGPALVRGNSTESRLLRPIHDDEMPPRDDRYKLSIRPVTEPEQELIRQWIDGGAIDPPPIERVGNEGLQIRDQDRQWWAFQPPGATPVPRVAAHDRARTPVDDFLLKAQETHHPTFSPEADRRTLVRRAYVDLLGLTPSAEETQAFLGDDSPNAFDRLIDRLLASPRYGECWAQHWLDAAGYADSSGASGDTVYPLMTRYRDYVVRAINRHGQSGIAVSEIMTHLARHVDDLCVIRSMWTEHINHEPALWMFHTGRTIPGRPTLGSWLVYGLGSECQDLPAYVVLDDPSGLPTDGLRNWSSGWLPPQCQGTRFPATGTPVWNLNPAREVATPLQNARRELLCRMDQAHRNTHPGEPELDARLANYALAARMQLSATAALDLSRETQATQAAYGIGSEPTDSYGRRCLLARRLVESGVRYVQILIDGQIWDHHTNLEEGLRGACRRTDQPIAALLADLKQRGLLDETLVVWGGEFGRLPISQSKSGRDHGRQGFTLWMAGGGVKGGHIHGATDEFGYAAVDNRVSVPDLHATILHLLGMDHEKLTFSRNGLEERLTRVYEPRIVREILS